MQEGSKEVGGEWWAPPRESIVEKIDRWKRKSRTKVKLALGGLPQTASPVKEKVASSDVHFTFILTYKITPYYIASICAE